MNNLTYKPIAVINGARRKAQRPFVGLVRGWHAAVAKKVNDWDDDYELYFEYDRFHNKFIIATSFTRWDPDQYETGHTAGKIAMFLGGIPVVLGFFLVQIFAELVGVLPEHWAIELSLLALLLAGAFFCAVAFIEMITLSVELQASREST